MELDIATMIAGAAVTGGMSAGVTVIAMRVELRWLKDTLSGVVRRVDRIENHLRPFQTGEKRP